MIIVYQIFTNRIYLKLEPVFKLSPTIGFTCGHDLKLFNSQSQELRRNYFSNRVIKDWNSLLYEVIHVKSKLLDCYWSDFQYHF